MAPPDGHSDTSLVHASMVKGMPATDPLLLFGAREMPGRGKTSAKKKHQQTTIHSLMFGGYPPTAIGYPPTAIGYPPTAIGYPPTAIGYPPTAIGYPPTAIGYPPTAIGYPPTAIGYPPTAIGSTPTAIGSTPTAIGSTPTAIVGRIGHSEFFLLLHYGTP